MEKEIEAWEATRQVGGSPWETTKVGGEGSGLELRAQGWFGDLGRPGWAHRPRSRKNLEI